MRPADLPIISAGALFLFEPFFVVSPSFLRAHLIRRNGDHTKKIYTFYDADSIDSRRARKADPALRNDDRSPVHSV